MDKVIRVVVPKEIENIDLKTSIDVDIFKCPYDVNNIGRCHYPRSKQGDCTCILRHHTSSKEYVN